jgi:hypothetical protein
MGQGLDARGGAVAEDAEQHRARSDVSSEISALSRVRPIEIE